MDFELLDGVDAGDERDVVTAGLGVVGRAVKEEFVAAVEAAVNGPVGDGAVVEGALIDGITVELDPGDEHGEHEGVAGVEGEFLDATAFDDGPAIGLGGFEEGDFAGDGDLIGDGTDFQDDIEGGALADAEGHAVASEAFEPRGFDGDGDFAGAEKGDGVVPVGVGGCRGEFVGCVMADLDRDVGDRATGGVADAAGDGGSEFLSESKGCGGEQKRAESKFEHRVPPNTLRIGMSLSN